MAKILLISNFYPPVQSIATNRVYSFAKYLTEFGHLVTVLTVKVEKKHEEEKNGNIQVIRVDDGGWIKQANTNNDKIILIHYLKCFYNIILSHFVVDELSGWTKNAIVKARELMKSNSYECVISSAPPISSHIIASVLKEEYPAIKWIADMRDAIWTKNYPYWIRNRLFAYAKYFLRQCDAFTAVSKPQLEEYSKMTEGAVSGWVIRNGYDFEAILSKKKRNGKFTIIYSGNFYGPRKPDNFFRALGKLLSEKKIEVCVRIIGNNAPLKVPENMKKYILQEMAIPYLNLIREIKKTGDLLLLISPSSLEKGIYTGKLFDYLGCCVPILGIVPKNDVAAELILKASAGYIAENENIDEIERAIFEAYNDWQANKDFSPDMSVIYKHHRREQAKKLDGLIRKLC